MKEPSTPQATELSKAGPQLVVAGNLLLDDVVYADGTTRLAQPGGAALYAALGAALWGTRVGIVTRIGDDYPAAVVDSLARRGVDVAGAGAAADGTAGPTLRTWLLYEDRRRRIVHRLDGPSHDDVSPRPDELPAAWHPAAIHLAPMPWARQRQWIAALAPSPSLHLSADPYELLTEERFDEWRRVFGAVDTLFLSEDEMQVPDGLDRPEPVLARLGTGAPRLDSIVYKRGAAGGTVWRTGSPFLEWTARSETVADPTGAGDAFAGGFLAGLLLGEPLRRRLERGIVTAAYALAAPGADGLLAADPREARRRLSEAPPRA